MPTRIKVFLLFLNLILASPAVAQENQEESSTTAPAPVEKTQNLTPAENLTPAQNWNVGGALITEIRANQKPSGLAGVAPFQVPWISLQAARSFEDATELKIEVTAATPTTGTVEIAFRQVSVKVPDLLAATTDLEVGLISQHLFSTAERFWFLRRLGSEFQFPLVRYGYLPDTDYGFQLKTRIGETWSLGLAITNGEGWGQAETGVRKDFSVWLAREWKRDERSFLFSLFAVRGGYESLPYKENNRDRAQISLATVQAEGLSAGLEYNLAADPADGLTNNVADQVNLTSLAGTRVDGAGYAGYFNWARKASSGTVWSLFSRADRWEPVKGDGHYAVVSSQIGIGYRPRTYAKSPKATTETVQWFLYNSLTSYGQLHSTTARDQQSWRISLGLDF